MSRTLHLRVITTDTFLYKCDNCEYANTYALSKILLKNQELIDVFADIIFNSTDLTIDVAAMGYQGDNDNNNREDLQKITLMFERLVGVNLILESTIERINDEIIKTIEENAPRGVPLNVIKQFL